MRPTRLPVLFALASVVAACSSESRLWRLSPFSGSEERASDRMNLWPLAYSGGSGTSILWPLIDADANGFAVRPLVSHDGADWDVLFPLSHFDADSGNGWALTAYQYGDDVGLFPLFHFGPGFNYFLPAFWNRTEGEVSSWGIFPIAAATDGFGFVGPAWWTGGRAGESFGLFPLFTWGALKWIGPLWWNDSDPEQATTAGLFPLAWTWGDPGRLLVLPLYYGQHDADADLHALLLPPTWWSTERDHESHVVVPLYAHFAHAGYDLTAWFPFYASKTTGGESHWFSPIGDGWDEQRTSGLNLYPLWYSARSEDPARVASRQMLLPFYLYRESGADRLLLTPLGGRGWNTSGTSYFTNVLGPVYHHSVSPGSETTAVAWPLFRRDREGDTTTTSSIPFFGSTSTPAGSDTWFLGGLGRYVAKGEESSLRFVPFYSRSDAAQVPDLLFDFALVGSESHDGVWSSHAFPFYWASGNARESRSDSWLLAGLGRQVSDGDASSFRLFPLYSQSSAAESPDPLFDATLVGFTSHGERMGEGGERGEGASWSGHVFPLYWGGGDATQTGHSALLGLARVATTEQGSAWRLWPLASASNDSAADGWIDTLSLFRHERTESGRRDWLLPLYYASERGEDVDLEVVPPLFHHETTANGSAWRLWPLFTDTDEAGLEGWLDPITLFASHEHAAKTHVHVGTDAIFGFDRFGEGKRTWNARLFTLCEFGHSERTVAAAQAEQQVTVERNHAGFLFDWFLVDRSVTIDHAGERHAESHYRLPLLHEYEATPEKKEWDLLCYAVRSTESADEGSFSVLGYGYRSERKGDAVKRDIFPFVTWDTSPQSKRVSFLWHLFHYERDGGRTGGHVLFIPWGETD